MRLRFLKILTNQVAERIAGNPCPNPGDTLIISESVVESVAVPVRHDRDVSLYFIPLTLGLAFLLAIMETTYVISGKEILLRSMTKFLGKTIMVLTCPSG